MTRRRLLVPLVLVVLTAVGALVVTAASGTTPTLGLDLQGGFSVVLDAKEVDGRLPSEESVEKAKEIMRQRVDGLGVAEPDITRQGRTVIVQLPGVENREQAECVVGSTARLEFRPVVSIAPLDEGAPGATTTTVPGATTTTAPGATTTVAGATTTTAPGDTTTAPAADGEDETGMAENGTGVVGIAPGEGALPAQFAPPTTTTIPPTTTTEAPPATTTTAPAATTTVPPTTTTTAPTSGSGSTSDEGGCGVGGGGAAAERARDIPPAEGGDFPAEDGTLLYTLGPSGFGGDALSSAQATLQNEWLVSVDVKGGERGRANEVFNACYQGAATCPPQGADETGTARGAIAIVLDGQVISAPTVNGPDLASDEFQISGQFGEGEAKELALVLRYGALPVEFEQAALQQVSATLGRDTLQAGMVAGLAGVAALALYMVLYYRGFGMIVVISLVVWGALMWGLVCLLSETQGLALTLAGVTGIIVSIGTTVDTYVVVFERVKDEIRAGRPVRIATERGYQSGIRTVYTANGAAFIGAFLLWWLTVGPVRGFAYFLGLSVLLDLAVAVLFTRPLMLLLGRSPRFARGKLFGVGRSTDQQLPIPEGATS